MSDPLLWAVYASEGQWRLARHLEVLGTYLMKLYTGEIKRLAISFPPRHGKALAVETPVYTPSGWKDHGDLAPGDEVFAPDGTSVRVIARTEPFWEPSCRVRFSCGESIVAGASHDWDVLVDRDCKRGQCTAEGLGRGHLHEVRLETEVLLKGYTSTNRRRPQIPLCGALDLPDVDLPIDPYVLGMWLGDGTSRMDYVHCGREDVEHFAPYADTVTEVNGHYRLLFRGLKVQLRELGVLGNKRVPERYLHGSIQQRLSLLQGLLDTDGYIARHTGQAEFCSTTRSLALAVKWLLASLGIKAGIGHGRATLYGKDCGPKWRVSFTPDASVPVFRLNRRRVRQRPVGTQATRRTVDGNMNVGVHKVNCVQVEGGRYLAGRNLVPTHNSELVSKYFTTWWLGNRPKDHVVLCSYGERLTTQWSRAARDMFAVSAPQVFGVDTWSRSSVTDWHAFKEGKRTGGGIYAVGKGGGLTGRGAHLLVCDDLIRDDAEARNPTLREQAWSWFQSVALTRLAPGGRCVMIATRWHHDDPIGRLETMQREGTGGEPWTFVNFPAIALENDPLGREPGDALWPERFDAEALRNIRAEVGPYTWESLYQGSPTPTEGGMFKREWFRYFKQDGDVCVTDRDRIPVGELVKFATADLAVSLKERADFTAVCVWGMHPLTKTLLLLDMYHKRVEGPDIIPVLEELREKWDLKVIYIEKTRFDLLVIQYARRAGLPVRELRPDKDKHSRALPATAVMEAGQLYFRHGATWLSVMERELLTFPNGEKDDQVDALAYGVRVFLRSLRDRRPDGGYSGGSGPGAGWRLGR